jgi:hypothetical protein
MLRDINDRKRNRENEIIERIGNTKGIPRDSLKLSHKDD